MTDDTPMPPPGGPLPPSGGSKPPDGPASLLSAAAVRARSTALLERGLAGELHHFTVHPERIRACAETVVATIRQDYPTLDISFHARWRHFAAGGLDRWGTLQEAMRFPGLREQARAAFDLAITSVLLDAGAGPAWSYEEGRTGEIYRRSEGLAVASFDLFIGGALSARPEDPCRADAAGLADLSVTELGRAFQVGADNPLVGLEGRTALLNRLGRTVAAAPDVFGIADDPRPGGLFDWLVARAEGEEIAAPAILEALLVHLGPVWPGRITLDGTDLGDTWRHPLAPGHGETAGLVPFHKLSQWLAYSLIEPLEDAGIRVRDLDGLTGLPEYRNGGLLLDTGVIALRRPEEADRAHPVGSEIVVEWRALTVALLDRVAVAVREALDLDAETFPLAKVLEGGTWAAGRHLAQARRGGEPPLRVESDGTVF